MEQNRQPEEVPYLVPDEEIGELVPDEDIILDVDTALDTALEPKEKRVIPTTRKLLSDEAEEEFIKEADEMYKYFSDVREKCPAVGVLGFNTFYKHVKNFLHLNPEFLKDQPSNHTQQTLTEYTDEKTPTE